MSKIPVRFNIRKVANNPDLFEFTVATPALRSQFRLPRAMLNQLRALIERALINK